MREKSSYYSYFTRSIFPSSHPLFRGGEVYCDMKSYLNNLGYSVQEKMFGIAKVSLAYALILPNGTEAKDSARYTAISPEHVQFSIRHWSF